MTRTLHALLCVLLAAVAFRLTVAGFVALSDLHEPAPATTIPVIDTGPTRDRIEVGRPLTVRA